MLRPAGGGPYLMIAAFWLSMLVRALTTALLVTLASAIAEALGPFWGALIASLPVSAGPAYVFLALDHAPDFVAASALSSFAANAATGLFLIVYGVLVTSRPQWQSLATAIVGWLAASTAIHWFIWNPSGALLLNLGVYGCGFVLLARIRRPAGQPVAAVGRRLADLPIRAVAVAAFVTLVVTTSSLLGAAATGIVAVFPISLISLIVIVRPRIGAHETASLAASALRSMLGFGLMLLAFNLAIRPWGLPDAFVTALAVSSSWSLGLLVVRRKAWH